MGVVYKLTDEVVDYIVAKKAENPKLSCRKLAAIVSEEFDVKVSKSSVNSVLKEHNLSGSVGRPASREQKKETFSIPQERKQQLFEQIEKKKEVLKDHTLQEEEQKPASMKEKRVEEPPHLIPDPVKEERYPPAGEGPTPEAPAETKRDERFEKEITERKNAFEQQKSPYYEGAGVMFLLAAQWELSLIGMFHELLLQHMEENLPKDSLRLCEAVCLLRMLGVKDEAQIEDGRTNVVWEILGEEIKAPVKDFWNRLSTEKMPRNFDVIFLNEVQQYEAEVGLFKYVLEDGSHYCTDIDLGTIVPDRGAAISRPLTKALSTLSAHVISNNRPVIFHKVSLAEEMAGAFKDFLSSFLNLQGKRLVRIDALNNQNVKLAEFTIIPQKRRDFILSLGANQRAFKELTKPVKWAGAKSLYDELTDSALYYTETKTEYFSSHFELGTELDRAITIWDSQSRVPQRVLLSDNAHKGPETVIREFLWRWPGALMGEKPENGQEDIWKDTSEVNNTKKINIIADYFDCVDELNKRAISYTAKKFFKSESLVKNESHLNDIVYNSSGSFVRTGSQTKVFFVPPNDRLIKSLVNEAAANINNAHICNTKKSRILMVSET